MEKTKHLIIDIGTSSIRVSVVNDRLDIEDSKQVKRKADITFDADQEWGLIKTMIGGLAPESKSVKGIAVSSLVGWVGVNRTGNAVTPCFSYMHQCPDQFGLFAEKYTNQDVYPINGRSMNPELGVFKIRYLKDENPEQYRNLYHFISLKDYINLKLTGEFAVDHTSACYSMAYDIHKADWSETLIFMAGVDKEKFPRLVRPYEKLGMIMKEIAAELEIPEDTPVAGGGSDGSVGILGAGGVSENTAVSVMGTTDVTFIISAECKPEETQSLVVNPHVIPGLWLIGGPMGMFGGTVDWLMHNIMYDSRDVNRMNKLVEMIPAGCDGLKFIPTLLGERTPFWNSKIQGTMVGIRPFHRAEHIFKAVMEANGYTLRRILELAELSGVRTDKIISIGGGSKSKQWLQIRSDIAKLPVFSARVTEATTVGSAMLSMIMTGVPIEGLPVVSTSGSCRHNRETAERYDSLYTEYLQLMSTANKIY